MLDGDLYRPRFHLSKWRCEGDFRGVSSYSDAHKTIQVRLTGRIEQPPPPGQIALEHGMKITRFEAIGITTDET